jgi:hypothetical protein
MVLISVRLSFGFHSQSQSVLSSITLTVHKVVYTRLPSFCPRRVFPGNLKFLQHGLCISSRPCAIHILPPSTFTPRLPLSGVKIYCTCTHYATITTQSKVTEMAERFALDFSTRCFLHRENLFGICRPSRGLEFPISNTCCSILSRQLI